MPSDGSVASIDITGDTTFALGLEAQSRGHGLWYYTPDKLSFNDGKVTANATQLFDNRDVFFKTGGIETRALDEFDVILMRQDPPFDMAYITATHILEHLPKSTIVVNNPGVRNAPEKLLVTHYPDLLPATLISRDSDAIEAFREKHKDIIVKPLFGNGGAGVFRIQPNDQNLNSCLRCFLETAVNRYSASLSSCHARWRQKSYFGEWRTVGAVNRVPNDKEARSNFHVGGTAATALTARDKHMPP